MWLRSHLVCALAGAVGALVLGSVPATAARPLLPGEGTAIVYRCGSDFENLCRFTFDGAPPMQLTLDGQPKGPLYASPSLSADGTWLASTFGNEVFLADRSAAGCRRGKPPGSPSSRPLSDLFDARRYGQA